MTKVVLENVDCFVILSPCKPQMIANATDSLAVVPSTFVQETWCMSNNYQKTFLWQTSLMSNYGREKTKDVLLANIKCQVCF
jgi:hypothetical protein